MRIGLFTDGLKDLSRREAFAWCVEHGIARSAIALRDAVAA